jgi:hypothetical protein
MSDTISITSPESGDSVPTTFSVSGTFTLGEKMPPSVTVKVTVTYQGGTPYPFSPATLDGSNYTIQCSGLPVSNGKQVSIIANLLNAGSGANLATSNTVLVKVVAS